MHINIYGPTGVGKTRYAEELRKHFHCDVIVDESQEPGGYIRVPPDKRALILSTHPIRLKSGVIDNVPAVQALREIGRTAY